MTDDLTARLLDLAHCNHDDVSVAAEAADEIERLQEENAKLRGICRTLVDSYVEWQGAYHLGELASARINAAKALGHD